MKKKRSLCAALLAGLMVTAVCLTGCGKKADDNAGGGSSDPDKVYQVGVCQLTQHDALDAATQGFVDALNTILGSEHVNIDVQVASGDSTTCTPIVNSFVNKKVDLIMANATRPCRQPITPPPPFPFSAPPLRSTAWRWDSPTSAAPWAATSAAPPIWRP